MAISRRTFLGTSAAAVVVAGGMARGKVFGANDRIGVATIGFNGQGGSHIRDICGESGAEIVALCDVDAKVLSRGVGFVEEKTGKKPAAYEDMRDLMADDSVDAVTIATPNHWHTLASIWACEAGKDVYVEKPLSHSVYEGQQLVACAEKHKRMVMHGTQSRSSATYIRDMRLMHEGFIGDMVHCRGVVYKNGNRGSIGRGVVADPPEHLNYTLWQGPASERPYRVREGSDRGLFIHYNWHWLWDYGNGEIGNQGVHEMDLACWAMNRGLPVKVMSQGGRYGLNDDGETPNTQATSFTYADGTMLTFEVRNLGSFYEGVDGGKASTNSYFGTEGFYVRDQGFFSYDGNKPMEVTEETPEGAGKWTHWFNAIRSRNVDDMTAPVHKANIGCAHIHIGNIAYQLGRSLEFDPETMRFKNDDEANALLKRADYREGFEVPQYV